MDWRFFQVLNKQLYFFKQEIILSTKNLFYFFPPKFYLPAWLVKTISEIIFFSLVGYAAGGSKGALFAMIGNCTVTVGRSIITRGSGLIANEKWMGTLSYIVISPFRSFRFVIGRNTLNILEGFITSLVIFLGIGLTFNLLKGNLVLLFVYIIVSLLLALSMIGLSMIIAGITFYVRTSMYVSSSIWLALMIFCGVTFPITYLPPIMQKIAYWLPMTNGILAIRTVIEVGSLHLLVFKLMLMELGIGMLFFLIGTIVLKFMIYISLKEGTLDCF